MSREPFTSLGGEPTRAVSPVSADQFPCRSSRRRRDLSIIAQLIMMSRLYIAMAAAGTIGAIGAILVWRRQKAHRAKKCARFGYTIVYVSDPSASVLFYEKSFGFARRFVTPENDYAELVTGNTTLSFASKEFGRSNLDGLELTDVDATRPAGMEIAVVLEDVPAAVSLAMSNGAKLLKPPTKKPWGQMVAYVRAPDGMLVEVCTPIGAS